MCLLKIYAKLSLPQVYKAPQTYLVTFLSLQLKPTHQLLLVGKKFFGKLFSATKQCSHS